jgi:hypothetical protein
MQKLMQRGVDELSAFGAWWVHEVRDAWTAVMERVAPQSSRHFTLDLSGAQGVLSTAGEDSAAAVVPIMASSTGQLPALSEAWPQASIGSARVMVLLHDSATLTCLLRLPPVAERDVARAVELQLERELPLPREQLYVDWWVQEKGTDQSRVVVVLMARRQYIDTLRDSVREWGWRILAIRGRSRAGQLAGNLLPSAGSRWSFAIGGREGTLVWSCLALCCIYIALVAGQWSYERFSLAAPLERAREQISQIRSREAQLRQDLAPITALRNLMQGDSPARALAAMSTVLPANAWAYHTDIRTPPEGEATLSFEGYTASATQTVEALGRSSQFKAVELVQAASDDQGSGRERIEIRARLERSSQQ